MNLKLIEEIKKELTASAIKENKNGFVVSFFFEKSGVSAEFVFQSIYGVGNIQDHPFCERRLKSFIDKIFKFVVCVESDKISSIHAYTQHVKISSVSNKKNEIINDVFFEREIK